MKRKFNVGDRVVPKKKSCGLSLDNSVEWNSGGRLQGFLYVTGYYKSDVEDEEILILAQRKNDYDNGDFYYQSDIKPYKRKEIIDIEEIECIWNRVKKPVKLNKDVYFDLEWINSTQLIKNLHNRDISIIRFADDVEEYSKSMNLEQIKKLYDWLGDIISLSEV